MNLVLDRPAPSLVQDRTMTINISASEYLASIGSRGGKAGSAAKKAARISNLKAAWKAKQQKAKLNSKPVIIGSKRGRKINRKIS